MSQTQTRTPIEEEPLLTREVLSIIVESLYHRILELSVEHQAINHIAGQARRTMWQASGELANKIREIVKVHEIMSDQLRKSEIVPLVVPEIIDLSIEEITKNIISHSENSEKEQIISDILSEKISYLRRGHCLKWLGEPCALIPDNVYTVDEISIRNDGHFIKIMSDELEDWQKGFYELSSFEIYKPKEGDIVKYIGTDKALGDAINKEFEIVKIQTWGSGQPYFNITHEGTWLAYPAIEFQFIRMKEQQPIILSGPTTTHMEPSFDIKDTWLVRYIGPAIGSMIKGTWCTITKGKDNHFAKVVGGGEGEYLLSDFEIIQNT